ncbi:MAG: hypothetical protein WCG01_04105 [bacterium]
MNKYYLIALGLATLYLFTKIAKIYLFSGFAPFVNMRRSQAQAVIGELFKEKMVEDPVVYSLGSGQFGFLSVLQENMPKARLVGVENNLRLYIIEKLQLLSKFSPIQLKAQKRIYSLKFDDIDLIYCDLSLEDLTELPLKFKYECRPGTIILSMGTPIPNLEEKRGFDLPPVKSIRERLMFWRHDTLTAKKDHGNSWVYLYEI